VYVGLRTRLQNFLARLFFVIAALLGLIRPGGSSTSTPPRDHWTTREWSGDEFDFEYRGGQVRYLDYGVGPPLVLLHGMACCWQWWLECIPELAQSHRVIAIDAPGFGASDALPVPATIDDHADAVAALLENLGVSRATVVGHSMGGLTATSMSQRDPDLVGRLVLVDAGGVPMSERRLRAVLKVLRFAHRTFTREAVLRLLATSRPARRIMLRGALADPDTMSDELAAVVVPKLNAPGFGDAIAASAVAVRASRPELILTPTSLIWGEHDIFAPVQTARDMLRRLPDGHLEVLDGLGHSPMVESPKEFCAVLMREAARTGKETSRLVT